jgi:2-hydroxychromene-2-carboxylate isomerase
MPAEDSAFYFDLGSPLAYLAAEQVLGLLPGPLPWIPVLARELPCPESFEGFRCESEREVLRSEIERRGRELSLLPLRWPTEFPFDSTAAMRVATYAAAIGRGVAFAQAAFRQAFAGGHSLGGSDPVLIAGAACEMHPRAVLQATARGSVAEQLADATRLAGQLGIDDVPAVRIGDRVFLGERAPREAARYLGAAAATAR